jgi:hypothetical protein
MRERHRGHGAVEASPFPDGRRSEGVAAVDDDLPSTGFLLISRGSGGCLLFVATLGL